VTAGPEVTEDAIRFVYPDEDRALAGVRLFQEIRRPRNGPEMTFVEDRGAWEVDFPRPNADRMEYQFELTHRNGGTEVLCDPHNPVRAPGAFGDKSVVELPGYEAPAWIDAEGDIPPGSIETFDIRSRILRGSLPVMLWSPHGTSPDDHLPMLIAHDGPEYARYSALTTMLDRFTSNGTLPLMRAALVGPHDRDQTYSASAAYARAFAHEIIPPLVARAPTPHGRTMRVGMGASLGALAMLHIHRRAPATFGALYLQSGSYFRQRFDSQESGFSRFRRISRFVGEVLSTGEWAHPITATLTCGTVEENLFNNRATRDALARQGYEVRLIENRDAHNWIGWRDTFDPHLIDLLNRMWR